MSTLIPCLHLQYIGSLLSLMESNDFHIKEWGCNAIGMVKMQLVTFLFLHSFLWIMSVV